MLKLFWSFPFDKHWHDNALWRRGSIWSFSLLPALSLVSSCNLQLWKTPAARLNKRNVQSRFLDKGNWFQQADKQRTFCLELSGCLRHAMSRLNGCSLTLPSTNYAHSLCKERGLCHLKLLWFEVLRCTSVPIHELWVYLGSFQHPKVSCSLIALIHLTWPGRPTLIALFQNGFLGLHHSVGCQLLPCLRV